VQIFRDIEFVPQRPGGSVVTIGAYDGVHLGHRTVIAEVKRLADGMEAQSVVVTFDRHPAEVVRPQSAPKLLTDLSQKLELLGTTGIDATLVVPFDATRATESPEDFVYEVLVKRLGVRCVVVGEDFHFGKDRRGNVALLRTLGEEHGFTVSGIDLVGGDGQPTDGLKVSSTQIRHLLHDGDAEGAAKLLGRNHEVRGPVVHGDARGRTLGFPTANVAVPTEICLPADGIYAGWFQRPDGTVLPAAINLGRRPTFYDAQPYSLLEAFLIEWSGDLYDEPAHVRFVKRLRAEMKFDSIDALVAQMNHDVAEARKVLRIA
jgi:riboflavin kinase / FMN adenylyltransferase